jgi:hypothetical protein
MKTYYKIQCEIEVEASDDDVALAILTDAINLYPGVSLHRWIDTTLYEREYDEHGNRTN